jgi:branched-chain amino acid aminotransferase
MVQLQKPEWVFMGGRLRPWEDARLHVSAEGVNRGLSVFEGIKGYWNSDSSSFGLLALPRHYARLKRSARLLHLPFQTEYPEFLESCSILLRALCRPDRDMWVRATLYVVEGHWGEGTVCDLVLTAYHQNKVLPDPIAVGVSTWRRSGDNSLPPRVKSAANYQVGRLARIEGRQRGLSEMVLLNEQGRVAESTGACILMVRDGILVCPPASEGALESITVELISAMAGSLGLPLVRRPVERTELSIADELALLGTLAEITPVLRVDEHVLPQARPTIDSIRSRFISAVRMTQPHDAADMTVIAGVRSRSLD